MSLRTFLALSLSVVVLAAIVAAAAAVHVTTLLDRTAADLRDSVAAIRAAGDAENDLLMVDALSTREDLLGADTARTAAIEEHHASLVAGLERASGFDQGGKERRLLARAYDRVNDYFAERQHSRGLSAVARVQRSRPAFQAAREALDAYVGFREDQADSLTEEAARLDKVGDAWGYSSAAAAVLSMLGVLLIGWRWVVGPLFAVRDAIGRYTRGEPTVALRESGPAELRVMVRTFNEMVTTLERQRRGQLGFLGGVVHDLRNPLTALRAGVATLRPDRPLPEEARLRKVVAMVDRQLARMDRMTGDLLETTRVVAGQLVLQLEDRDLRELVEDAVALFQPVSKDHRLATSLPSQPVPVRCDPTRIEQVLGNLLSNAIKYSPGGGQVQVSLTVRGGVAEILVSDRGVGLDADELAKIFDPFQRMGRPEAIPGTGLGLSVVKRIVEAHGGEVGVRSARGRGTTFWVHLPAAPPPSWSRTPAGPVEPAGASHRPH